MTQRSNAPGILQRRLPWIALLCLLSGLILPAPSAGAPGSAPGSRHGGHRTLIKRVWGVEILGVRESAAGYMLEFRYKVLDAEKAKPLFVRKTKPVLIHEATGARLVVPEPAKTGPLRNSDPPIEGQTYWMFFANPGRFVKPGESVSVVIGDFRAEGLVVQ